MKKFIVSLSVLLIWLISTSVNALTVWTIDGKYGSNPDIQKEWVQTSWNHAVLDIIAMVNSYLWFGVWFFCFIFMIWNGYQLIMANGDEKKVKSATSALVGCAIWIVVCLLAYVIVRVAIKLFA